MLKKTAAILAIVLVLGAGGAVLFRESILKLALVTSLDEQGLGPTSLLVTSANLKEIKVESISLLDGQIKIANLSASYSLSSLLLSQFSSITISEVEISGNWNEGGLSFGNIEIPLPLFTPETNALEQSGDTLFTLPFRNIEIDNATARLIHPQGEITVTANLSAQNHQQRLLDTMSSVRITGPQVSGVMELSGEVNLGKLANSTLAVSIEFLANSFSIPGSSAPLTADISLTSTVREGTASVYAGRNIKVSAPWPMQLGTQIEQLSDQKFDIQINSVADGSPFFYIEPNDFGYIAKINLSLIGETPLGRADTSTVGSVSFGSNGIVKDISFEQLAITVTDALTAYGMATVHLDASGIRGEFPSVEGVFSGRASIDGFSFGEFSSEDLDLRTDADFKIDGLALSFEINDLMANLGRFQFGTELTGYEALKINLADQSSALQKAGITFTDDGSTTFTFDAGLGILTGPMQLSTTGRTLPLEAVIPEIRADGYWSINDSKGNLQAEVKDGLVKIDRYTLVDFFIAVSGDVHGFNGNYRTGIKSNANAEIALTSGGELSSNGDNYALNGVIRLPSNKSIGRYSVDFSSEATDGTISISSGPLQFGGNNIGPSDLRPLRLPFTPTAGEFAANAKWSFANGTLTDQEAGLLFKDVDIESDDAVIRRLNSVITLDSVSPLGTNKPQDVSIGLLDVGLPVSNLFSSFTVESNNILNVSKLTMNFADGKVTGNSMSIDLNTQSGSKTELIVTDVSLPVLASMSGLEGIEATGSLKGRIPVSLIGNDIIIENGKLNSSGPGILRYIPDGAANTISNGEGGMTLALQALENFEYDSLEVTVSGSISDELEAAFSVKGRNPDLYDGYPIDFNLNLSGELANILKDSMAGYRVPETIKRQLTTFPSGNN